MGMEELYIPDPCGDSEFRGDRPCGSHDGSDGKAVHATRLRARGRGPVAAADPFDPAAEQHLVVAAFERNHGHGAPWRVPPEIAVAAEHRRARPEVGHGRRE